MRTISLRIDTVTEKKLNEIRDLLFQKYNWKRKITITEAILYCIDNVKKIETDK